MRFSVKCRLAVACGFATALLIAAGDIAHANSSSVNGSNNQISNLAVTKRSDEPVKSEADRNQLVVSTLSHVLQQLDAGDDPAAIRAVEMFRREIDRMRADTEDFLHLSDGEDIEQQAKLLSAKLNALRRRRDALRAPVASAGASTAFDEFSGQFDLWLKAVNSTIMSGRAEMSTQDKRLSETEFRKRRVDVQRLPSRRASFVPAGIEQIAHRIIDAPITLATLAITLGGASWIALSTRGRSVVVAARVVGIRGLIAWLVRHW